MEGALGLGDETDRGGRAGSMGDALPLLSLGTGKVAVAPSPTPEVTLPPTPAPTVPATPAPTLEAQAPVRGVWYHFFLVECSIQITFLKVTFLRRRADFYNPSGYLVRV